MNLVTGGTGIVGSHIVANLLSKGEAVRVLARENSSTIAIDQLLSFHQISQEGLEYIIGDVNDPMSLRDAIKGCTHVYHCAAMVSFEPGDERDMHVVNTVGTANIVNACLEMDLPLAYLSSTAAIGDQKVDGVYSEESEWNSDRGRSAYSVSKRYAELEVFRGIQEGLSATIVNPGVVIGPGNWGKSSTTIFLTGKKGMRFYPTGSNGFVDARDVADITIDLFRNQKSSGRHLLIGENASFKQVFTLAAQVFGKRPPTQSVPQWATRLMALPLKYLEFLRLNPFPVSSENLKSAYRKSIYSQEKSENLGYQFRSIAEAMRYTKEVYDLKR